MTIRQRIARAKTGQQCINCQSPQVSHLGTSILSPQPRETEVEHRFRCRACFFRWSEYV